MINATDASTGAKSRAFTFKSGEGRDTIVSGFTLSGGGADTGGCMSITGAAPTIQDCMFYQCNATTGVSRGGAIYSFGNPSPGPLITGTTFILSYAVEGAAIYVGNSQLDVEGSYFEWGICPSATGRGGAICSVLANITVKDTVMENHIVGFGGGVIMAERSQAIIDGLTAHNNTSMNMGGALMLFGATVKVSNSDISGVGKATRVMQHHITLSSALRSCQSRFVPV